MPKTSSPPGVDQKKIHKEDQLVAVPAVFVNKHKSFSL